jgi:undecaprenyl-diphosphatase
VKPVWFFGAALVLGLVLWKRRKLEPTLVAGGLVAAVAMAVYGTGVVHLPNLDKLLEDVGTALGKWTYLLVGALAFLETGAFVGLLAPGETAIIVGGVVAGQGKIDIIALIALVWACAVAGDLTSFALGRKLGREFLVRHGPKVHISEERIQQVEGFFERHGGKAIFLGRFVGLVRAVAPFLAGSSGMALRRFVPYDVLGAGLWGTAYCVLGYVFWRSIDKVISIAKTGALALGATIVVVVGLVALVRWLRDDDNRERLRAWAGRQAQRPAVRPVVRVLAPVYALARRPALFVWNRLTPGQLGLELTTLLAIAAVGSFVLIGYWTVLGPDPLHLTAGDRRGLNWSEDLRVHWLDEAARIVTAFGTLPVAGGVLVLVALVLLARRDVLEGISLLLGLALTFAGTHIVKGIVDRPRPPGSLVDTSGAAYPSGHAAYAVVWVAIAIALRRALPNVPAVATAVTAGIVLAVAIGLSRIYLRAHWFSDVAGGWGLGALAFALCGMGALIVGFIRNNGDSQSSSP